MQLEKSTQPALHCMITVTDLFITIGHFQHFILSLPMTDLLSAGLADFLLFRQESASCSLQATV